MKASSPSVNWSDWLQRWDRQQRGYLPEREQRFEVMLDVVEALLPEAFVARAPSVSVYSRVFRKPAALLSTWTRFF